MKEQSSQSESTSAYVDLSQKMTIRAQCRSKVEAVLNTHSYLKDQLLSGELEYSSSKSQTNSSAITQILESTAQYDLTAFNGNDIKVPNIVTLLAEISFPNLQDLRLRGNSICTMEGVWRSNMPKLSYIWLNCNNLTSVATFRKACLPNLKSFAIDSNYVKEVNGICQGDFPNLNKINLQFSARRIQSQNINWTLKLQSNKMKEMYIDRTRIPQNHFREVLSKKYKDIMLNTFGF